LEPFNYALLVLILAFLLDQIFDNLVSPRLLGDSLGVHPAAVLVAAIVAANLIGIIGLILAAPVLATMNLLSRYVFRKMIDLDPWPEEEYAIKPMEAPSTKLINLIKDLWKLLRQRLRKSG